MRIRTSYGLSVKIETAWIVGDTHVECSPVHDVCFQTLVNSLYDALCYRLRSKPIFRKFVIRNAMNARTFRMTVGGIQ